MVEAPDGFALSRSQEETLVELLVWAAAAQAEPASPILYEIAENDYSAFAFSSVELGLAVDVGQADLVRSTVWELLRALPPEAGLVIDPGQDSELRVTSHEVERLLGVPAPLAPALPPALALGLARSPVLLVLDADGAVSLAARQDGQTLVPVWTDRSAAEAFVPPGGRLAQVLLGDLVSREETGPVLLDSGLPTEREISGIVARQLAEAYLEAPAKPSETP